MIYYDLKRHLKDHGIANASQLATVAKISLPLAYRVYANGPLDRIEVATLNKLAAAFGVKPLSLLTPRAPRPR